MDSKPPGVGGGPPQRLDPQILMWEDFYSKMSFVTSSLRGQCFGGSCEATAEATVQEVNGEKA